MNPRALNRATLHRQFLLGGVPRALSLVDTVHRLAGLNAQDRDGPSLSLAARGRPDADIVGALEDRTLVRAPMLRATQHIVTAADYLAWWPALRPVLARAQRFFARQLDGVDTHDLAVTATDILAEGPLTRTELGVRLARRWPGNDPKALASSVQFLVPIVHPPGPGTRTALALADAWLGRPIPAGDDPRPPACCPMSTMLMASRLLYGMANRGVLPRPFAMLSPRRTPWFAIVFTTALSILLLTTVNDLTGLSGTTVLLLTGVFLLVNIAALVLRRERVPHRHFRAPTIAPILGAAVSAIFLLPFTRELSIYLLALWLLLGGVALWAVNRAFQRSAASR